MDADAVKAEADRLKADSERRIQEVRQRPHLSDYGRKSLIAAEVQRCADGLDQLRAKVADETAAERRALEKKVWANPGSDVIAWRDSMARVAALKDHDQASALYRQADLSGDEQLLKSMVLDGRWGAVTAGYEAEHAEWAAAAAFRDHDRGLGSARSKLALSMLLSPPFAEELGGASPGEVARLASQAATG